MNRLLRLPPFRNLLVALFFAACCTSCEWEVPLTSQPTRSVDEQLLGDWEPKEADERISVGRWGQKEYVVFYMGDFYRAFHSDFEKQPLISVQEIKTPRRNFSVIHYQLSADGKTLTLKAVKPDLVSDRVKTSASLQKALGKLMKNTNVFGEEAVFRKKE